MQQTVKAKAVNVLQEKLEVQDAFDESNDMNEKGHSDELFDLLYKTSNNTCRNKTAKIFKSFVDQKPHRQISSFYSLTFKLMR